MIHYVAVTATPSVIERLLPRLRPALRDTKLLAGTFVRHVAADRTWAFAAFTASDRLADVRVAADADALLAFNGTALSASGDQAGLADGLLQRFRKGGVPAVVGALGGSYNVVATAPEQGFRAFPDFSGLYPTYWGHGTDFAVVSNRATTVSALIGDDTPDLDAHAWVIGHGSLFGDALPQRGVFHVPPGHEVQALPAGNRFRLERSVTWSWPDPSAGEGRDNLTDDEWDDVTASLVANFQALDRSTEPLRVRLTGGKDSRLCLALALAAGRRDHIETITTGPYDSPEVEAASEVARVAGVPHRRFGPPVPDPATALDDDDESEPPPAPPFDPEPVWRSLRQGVYRYESIVCAWSGLMNPSRPPVFNIKGFGGEFYRRANVRQRDQVVTDLDELAASFLHFQQVHDPLKVLHPEVVAAQEEWMRTWVHEQAREVRRDLLPEKLYVDYRLSHWTGALLQATPIRIDVNPLVSSLAMRKHLELSAAAHGAERFHYEVMRRAAPELVGVPFLDQTWHPDILASATVDLPTEPFTVTVRPRRIRSWGNPGWPLMEHEQLAIEKLFHAAMTNTSMDAICNMKRLKRLARRAGTLTRGASVKELFSCIGTSLALLGRAERVVDRPPAEEDAGAERLAPSGAA